jgi:hypothetical protein
VSDAPLFLRKLVAVAAEHGVVMSACSCCDGIKIKKGSILYMNVRVTPRGASWDEWDETAGTETCRLEWTSTEKTR